MHKLFLALFMILPNFAFAAVDVSDCEVIGYQKSSVTEKNCATRENCEQQFAEHQHKEIFDKCIANVQTTEECVAEVAKQQELARKEFLIYKCPANDARLQHKMKAEKDSVGQQKYMFYNDDTPIDTESMIADTENVYLFRTVGGIGPAYISEKTKFGYEIIGPADKDGMIFSWIDKE